LALTKLRRSRRRALLGMGAAGGLLSLSVFAAMSACNTGIFARPVNAGIVVCECTCGSPLDPDAGDPCLASCQAPFDVAQQVAAQDGCSGQFDAYSSCLADDGTCDGRSFDAQDCGTQEAALSKCEAAANPGG
jgi:hypothetical protein